MSLRYARAENQVKTQWGRNGDKNSDSKTFLKETFPPVLMGRVSYALEP